MLLLRLEGSLLLRFAERQFLPLLFQLPPRRTRFDPITITLLSLIEDLIFAETLQNLHAL